MSEIQHASDAELMAEMARRKRQEHALKAQAASEARNARIAREREFMADREITYVWQVWHGEYDLAGEPVCERTWTEPELAQEDCIRMWAEQAREAARHRPEDKGYWLADTIEWRGMDHDTYRQLDCRPAKGGVKLNTGWRVERAEVYGDKKGAAPA